MPRPECGERISDSGHSVKVINIDPSGKVRLSRKVLLKEGEGTSPKYPGAGEAHSANNPGGDDRGGRGDRDRGPRRDRDRGPRR
jgi:polyribonucleotide nucleotidyltransferase